MELITTDKRTTGDLKFLQAEDGYASNFLTMFSMQQLFHEWGKIEHKLSNEDNAITKDILNSLSRGKIIFPLGPQEWHYINLVQKDIFKVFRYLVYRFKFYHYPKDRIVSPFPFYLLIEPVSACNLRCIMCFQMDPKLSSNKEVMGKMDFDLFKKIIDEAEAEGTGGITLGSRGEPTLHKRLPEMLMYCKDKFLEIKLITNATRLSEELCNAILESGVTLLSFSVDSENPEIYERIRQRGELHSVIENIKLFNRVRGGFMNPCTVTRASGIKVCDEQSEKAFVEFFGELCDEVTIKPAYGRWNTYENEVQHHTHACEFLWERLYVWWDGTTNPCDSDYLSKLSPGNVLEHSIKEIWQGRNQASLRQAHIEGQRSDFFPCDRCGI